VLGQVRHDLTEMAWRDRAEHLWPLMATAFDEVCSSHDLVLIEGAGSPAEINLEDLVNNRVLEYANALALLVVDIDRGGAFAHVLGTHTLVPPSTRERLAGFVLNKFRGDESLLEPGPATLSEMTGMGYAGALPMLQHYLPDEEGATIKTGDTPSAFCIGIVRYPYASNLDEFHLIAQVADVRWITHPRDVADCNLVILPGSKSVAADLDWLRSTYLDVVLAERAGRGGPVLGICGGSMMLGGEIRDEHSVEGSGSGIGLLPVATHFSTTKVTREMTMTFPLMTGAFEALSGVTATGYEIRAGTITGEGCELAPFLWGRGAVLATTLHGLLEDPKIVEALSGVRPAPVLEATFDLLADAVDEHLDTAMLWRMVDGPSTTRV
jgi:adenosylcobyric acid synthase